VIFHENTTSEEVRSHAKLVALTATVQFTYDFGSFKGIAVALDESQLEALLLHPLVKEIHYDGIERIFQCVRQESAPSWGLPRCSFPGDLGISGLPDHYDHRTEATPATATVYVIDTGIYTAHSDFTGRARWGANYVDTVTADQHGHGTHCAGTVGGRTFGICKTCDMVAVKVLGATGSGPTSGVIAGIQFTATEHQARGGPSVASVSLGSTADGGKNAAVRAAVALGVVYSIAAGNSNANACGFYPASTPEAICVGATTIGTTGSAETDEKASYSNAGPCVTLFAPGTTITSAGISGPTSSTIMSGTSMACPHVSGALGVLLSQFPSMTPVQAKAAVLQTAQSDLIRNVGTGSPNKLLYTTSCDDFAA